LKRIGESKRSRVTSSPRRAARAGRHWLLWLGSFAAVPIGCFQELDPNAASGGPRNVNSTAPDISDAGPLCPDGQIPYASDLDLSGNTILCGDSDGDIPLSIAPLPIVLDDGATTSVACDQITQLSHDIRVTYCSGCHAPPAGMGGFNYVLDDNQLITAHSATYTDDAGAYRRMIIPGDPEDSWVYHRVAIGAMPPTQNPPLPPIPHPTISDISILHEWIENCLGASSGAADAGDAAPSDAQAGDDGPAEAEGGPDAGGGGG
jgi:hypothetical protein